MAELRYTAFSEEKHFEFGIYILYGTLTVSGVGTGGLGKCEMVKCMNFCSLSLSLS
jgi:hypothetical protein